MWGPVVFESVDDEGGAVVGGEQIAAWLATAHGGVLSMLDALLAVVDAGVEMEA